MEFIANASDGNRRIALHCQVPLLVAQEQHVVVHVIVVHFSFDDQQQCRNAAQLLRESMQLDDAPVIVLGDTNTYFDFEW
jgi:endonuclease/exonuclease/phosphatase family metal-dependent hydrolase